MKKSFSARRVPRKVGADEEEPTADDVQAEPTLKRPTSKPRKSSTLRTSFDPSAQDDEDEGGVATPKRSNLSRIAIQRNASKRSSLLAANLPARDSGDEDDRPSYSAASLQALKESTPSTPRDYNSTNASNTDVEDTASRTQALDLSSKFGSSLARYQQEHSPTSAIPSAAEIAEKKARRARLAKEQAAEEYISLDPDDPDLDADNNNDDDDLDDNVTRDAAGRLVLKPKKDEDKYGISESRLVREDEDILENFDEFTEDGKVHLGRRAEAEAARRRKEEMAAQIAEAEGNDDDVDTDSNASEQERNAAFEAAQTRHGTYGTTTNTASTADPYEHLRPKTPPIISPLPTLDGVLERLRRQLAEMQGARTKKVAEMAALRREKVRLGEEEVRIQRALRETAGKFAELRRERGMVGSGAANGGATPVRGVEGGVSGVGAAALALTAGDGDDAVVTADGEGEEGEDEEQAGFGNGGYAGLGFAGLGARGLGSTPGMGVPRGEESEDDY